MAGKPKPGDSFLVVTEGTVTEPIYFELLRGKLKLATAFVHVVPGDASDPRHVIKTADRLAKERVRKARRKQLGIGEPEKFDHVWAVVDTDVAVRNGIWNEVQQLANARKVLLAHSTPCFEFWLLLHFDYTTRADLVDGAKAKRALKERLGKDYSTNEESAWNVLPVFMEHWVEAARHATRVRRHHQEANTQTPANPSTDVDRLVRSWNAAAGPEYGHPGLTWEPPTPPSR